MKDKLRTDYFLSNDDFPKITLFSSYFLLNKQETGHMDDPELRMLWKRDAAVK